MRAIRTRAREVLQSLHGIVWRFKSTKLAKSKLAQDGGSSAGVVVNGVDSLGGYQHSSLRQSARLTLLRTFWVQAVQIILLFLLQAVFAEDISLSMNRANVNVSWFMGLLNVSSQLLLASISMSQQQHQKQKQQQEQQQQQQQQQQQGGEQQQQPVSQYMPLFNAKGDQPLAQTRQALLVYYLHSFLARYRWEYFVSSVAVVLFQVLNNYSTFLIAYNTVQLFMASKVAFVMAASALLVGRRYSYQAYFYCAVLVTGLYLLSQADLGSSSHASRLVSDLGTSAGPSEQIALDGNAGTREQLGETRSSDVAVEAVIRSMWGFTMTFISMVCISVHAIVQESVLQGRSIKAAACCAQLYRRLRRRAQEQFSSLPMRRQSPDISALMVRDELIFYTNIITLCLLLIGVAVSGDFHKGVAFFVAAPRRLLYEQIIVLLISSFGQRQVLKLAQEFGSTSATIVVTIRKCITFGISVLIFPKPVTYTHIAALGLISLSACSLQMCLLNDEATQQSIQQTKSSPTTDLLSSTDNASRGGSSHTQLSFSTARSRFGAMRSGSTPFEV